MRPPPIRFAGLLFALWSCLIACSPGTPPLPFPTLPHPTATAVPTAVPSLPTPAPNATQSDATPVPTIAAPPAGCSSLRLATAKAPTNLNSHLAASQEDVDASRLVLEPLAAYDPNGSVIPVLAAEIPTVANGGISRDFITTTWKLKTGVKWSDGTDFTAADVVFTYLYVSEPAGNATDRAAFDAIRSVEALDPYSVRIVWREPNPLGIDGFSGQSGHILQQQQFERYRGAAARSGPNLQPIGTGPYTVRRIAPGDRVSFVQNQFYRDANKGKPCFREVTLWGTDDPVTAATHAFVAGDADYVWNLAVDMTTLASLAAAPSSKAVLLEARTAAVERLSFNRTDPNPALGDRRSEPIDQGGEAHPFLADRRVREALAMVIDRQAISAKAFGRLALPTCALLPAAPGMRDCPSVSDATFAAAARLLDDAGWTMRVGGVRARVIGGRTVPMSVVFQTSRNPARQQSQLIIKNAWEKLGLGVELRAIASTVFFSNAETAPGAAKFFADVQMLASEPDTPDPAAFLRTWTCAEIRTRAQQWSGNNYERYCSRAYDALFERLAREADGSKRRALASQMHEMLIDELVVVPLVARLKVSARSSTLRGVVMNGVWDSEFWNVADWAR